MYNVIVIQIHLIRASKKAPAQKTVQRYNKKIKNSRLKTNIFFSTFTDNQWKPIKVSSVNSPF